LKKKTEGKIELGDSKEKRNGKITWAPTVTTKDGKEVDVHAGSLSEDSSADVDKDKGEKGYRLVFSFLHTNKTDFSWDPTLGVFEGIDYEDYLSSAASTTLGLGALVVMSLISLTLF